MTVSNLSPDVNQLLQLQLLNNLLIAVSNSSGTPLPTITLPTGRPANIDIWHQSLLYASLACSLFAALGAVLGIQWLSRLDSVDERGSLEQRCEERQRKVDNIETWHLRRVLEALSVLLQISLLLFAAAISAFMWTQEKTVAKVLTVVIGVGALCYFIFIGVSVVYPDSPFSTPLSKLLRRGFCLPLAALRLLQSASTSAIKAGSCAISRVQLCLHNEENPSTLRHLLSSMLTIFFLQLRNAAVLQALYFIVVFPWIVLANYVILVVAACWKRLRCWLFSLSRRIYRTTLMAPLVPTPLLPLQTQQPYTITSAARYPFIRAANHFCTTLDNQTSAGFETIKSTASTFTSFLRRTEDDEALDLTRSPSVIWLLDTSTDPIIRLDTLLLLSQTDWTEDLLRDHLSVGMLDLLLDNLVTCFEKETDGMRLTTLKEERAALICDAFLFIYWELHVLDVRAATCWILSSGRGFAESHSEILDCLKLFSTGSHRTDQHFPLRLMFITLKSHVDGLWYFIRDIETGSGEIQPKSDDLWSTLQEKRSLSTVSVAGQSRLAATALHPRTLVLMSQISCRDKWKLWGNSAQLRDAIAYYCRRNSSKEHTVMCLVALAITLGYQLEGDASLGMTATQ